MNRYVSPRSVGQSPASLTADPLVARDEVPYVVGPCRQNCTSEDILPERFVSVLVTPGPQAPREVMQLMLVGETHGAVHLVRDFRPDPSSFAHPRLGHRHVYRELLVIEMLECGIGRSSRGGSLPRQHRQLALDRLELRYRPSEL